MFERMISVQFICSTWQDSNEAVVMAILEAILIYSSSFQDKLIIESDSSNAISWVLLWNEGPSRFCFHFNDIKALSSLLQAFRANCK